ncbi:MAG: DUF2130 domain-containing protein [Ignavibacteria bacterium]|nr:DUF2130 domain-containing protein [Ignavibacteria bacterium]
MDNFVICQVCGAKIDVSKALYLQIEQTLKNHYEKEFHKKDEQFKQAIEQLENQRREIEADKFRLNQIVQEQVEARLTSEKQQLEENLKNQIYNENKTHIEALKQELNEKSQKIAELNNALAEIERLKREKQEIESRLKLEFEKQLTDNILLEQEKLRKHYEDNFLLKLKEKDKTIEDLMAKLEDARRRAEQGSMQLQGEVQELFLEEMLKELFPLDEIQEIKKGQRGGDIIQIVRNNIGKECGKIYYESKRTKNYDKGWISKLKEDNLEAKADILVLVTQAMPEGKDRYFFEDGVWVCPFSEIRAFANVMRLMIIQIYNASIVNVNRESKMELVYNYLTSREFADTFEAIITGFNELQKSYIDEKNKIMKIWKEREKQFDKILSNAVNLYGSIKGLAGSSIPDIKLLE